jgi:hypothetical protein
MARKTKKMELQRAQDPAAPFLFDEHALPYRPELVKAIKAGEHKHTGARLLDNHKDVGRLVELLTMGWGLKRIAKAMRVSKHSVRAARDELVRRGEMAPFKERVVAKFEEIIEVGATEYLRALEDGEVAAAQIPVGLGIISDKRALGDWGADFDFGAGDDWGRGGGSERGAVECLVRGAEAAGGGDD